MKEIKITFCGAARVVTGSCYLLEHEQLKFLVDCGLFHGNKELKERNYGDFPFTPGEIDFVLLTHAHIDHSGLLPKLYLRGFTGPIYATSGTVELCEVMLPDSGHIQEMEVERKNRKLIRSGKRSLTPIYTAEEAADCQRYFRKISYGQKFSPAPGIEVIMRDAGHILGSAMIEIFYQEKGKNQKIVFSGDLGRQDRPIINNPTVIEETDFLVIESTYGNRFHEASGNNHSDLADIINSTFRQGGNVIIPAFAVDRTQDLLYTLHHMMEEGRIQPHPIYIDSPLAIAATEVFCRHPQYFDLETRELMKNTGRSTFLPENLKFSRTTEESRALNEIKEGAIIISASGMADAGRIKHHLKHNLWRQECSVVFVGYQAMGTLGRYLVDGASKVKIHGEEIIVKAQIIMLEGYSAHSDQNEMMAWLKGFKIGPQKVFVTHGEEEAATHLAKLIRIDLGIEALAPYLDDVIDLAELPKEALAGKTEEISPASLIYQDIDYRLQELLASQSVAKLAKIRAYLENLNKDHSDS